MNRLLAAVSFAVCLIAPTFAHADALSIGDPHELGFVNFGIPSGDADRLNYVNHLIAMALGTTDNALGQNFSRSNNVFGSLPTAVFAVDGTGTDIKLGVGDQFSYLFAKYDGPNYGSEVWYIGDLSGIIDIPATGGKYGLSGWTLFGPGSVAPVPEPTSLMLLGTGAVGFFVPIRRKLLPRWK
jgi:hypothetical protein